MNFFFAASLINLYFNMVVKLVNQRAMLLYVPGSIIVQHKFILQTSPDKTSTNHAWSWMFLFVSGSIIVTTHTFTLQTPPDKTTTNHSWRAMLHPIKKIHLQTNHIGETLLCILDSLLIIKQSFTNHPFYALKRFNTPQAKDYPSSVSSGN